MRHLTILRRFAVLWFVLWTCMSGVAPLVQPMSIQIVCSGSSMKLVVESGDGVDGMGMSGMACALCAVAVMPTTEVVLIGGAVNPPLAYATQSIPAARLAAVVSAPLPARGPPARS